MNKSLANTVGTRINFFDTLENPTVEVFNNLFPECPVRDKPLDLTVQILGVESNNCRSIRVGDETIVHKMYSDILYTLDREVRGMDDSSLESINGVTL